ncbi:MAG TPA: CAP domain-containing protein [Candidatus Binatia bacterium]|nr:CAP domain-containing protein [Candidatus Binatia bacterium]
MRIEDEKTRRLLAGVLGIVLFAAVSGASAQDAPRLSPRQIENRTGPPGAAAGQTTMAWNTASRRAVAVAFARHYLPGVEAEAGIDWDGDTDQCTAGAVGSDFLDATTARINYFRAQAGVSTIAGNATLSAQCQETALVMARQGATSHYPADDFPGNPCLSVEAETAAAKSNLLLDYVGPAAIDRLMIDPGVSNRYAGHRRWLLYPRQQAMGNGSIPAAGGYRAAHCNHVIGSFKPATAAAAVPWPNQGYVPWQVVPAEDQDPARWSFTYPGAGFASATVSVERLGKDGGAMSVIKEQVANGYGDNTLVWKIEDVPAAAPERDTTYRVSIAGVTGASQGSFVYDVTVIDPYDLGLDLQPQGPAQPGVGLASTYSFDAFDDADSFDVRVARTEEGDWTEGAEEVPDPHVLDQTSGGYDLFSTAVKASGQRSFHLAAPGLDHPEQAFAIDRIVVPSADSVLRFKNLRRCASVGSVLRAQVSRDGQSWQTVWSRAGQALLLCTSVNWDAAFQSVSVPLPSELAGQTVQVRFQYTIGGSMVFGGTGTSLGFFVDDVEVTSSQELVDATRTELPAGSDSFTLTPEEEGELWLQVRPRIGDVRYAFSTPAIVTAVTAALLCGDGSGDGNVTALDALLALKAAVGAAGCSLQLCDVNGSGGLTASDALLVLKYAVGSDVALECPGA